MEVPAPVEIWISSFVRLWQALQLLGCGVEIVVLYRLDSFTGCVSCFRCKTKEHLGKCIYY